MKLCSKALRRSSALSTHDTTGCGCCGDVWVDELSCGHRNSGGTVNKGLATVDNQVPGLSG